MKRQALPATPDVAARSELDLQDEVAECTRCGCEIRFVSIAGGLVPAPRYCVSCGVIVAEQEAQAMAAETAKSTDRERVERAAKILDMIAKAGANATEHRFAELATFDATETDGVAVALARQFVKDVKAAGPYDQVRGAYFWGNTGTGKTHIAVGVLRALLLETDMAPHEIVYDHAAELIARIQNAYNGGSSFELLERRFDAKVWILDDLGTERASDDVARHLTLIFTRRALRPTLITSNMPPEQFERRSPELNRVGSRMGPAYFRIAQVQGRDRRFD